MFYDEKTRLRRRRGGALVSTCGEAVAGESEESKSEAGVRELGREGHSRVAAELERWVSSTRFSEDRRYT